MTHVFKWYSIWLISVDLSATMVKGIVLYLVALFSRSRASDVEKHSFISDRIPLFHFTTYRGLLRRHCSDTIRCLTISSSWVERNAEFPVSVSGLFHSNTFKLQFDREDTSPPSPLHLLYSIVHKNHHHHQSLFIHEIVKLD